MSRNTLKEALKSYICPKYRKEYLEYLLNLEISPFSNIKELNNLEMTKLESEIIKYNLTVKTINSISKHLPENSKLKVNNFDTFDLEVSLNHDWQIVNMLLGERGSRITYYDRTNFLKDKFDLANKLDELEEEYHHNYGVYYGHLDNTEKEIELATNIEDIKNRLYDLTLMEEDKEIFELDKILRQDLLLPSDEHSLIESDETYNTYNTTNNRNIKVYKKTIRKEEFI